MLRDLLCAFVLLSGIAAQAGDKVGNGGGLWTCSRNGSLVASHFVDLYEAKEEFDLDPIWSPESDPMKIVQERSDFIRLNLPDYSPVWNRALSETMSKIRLVNSELIVVEDSLHRLKPPASACSEPWVYTQFANYIVFHPQFRGYEYGDLERFKSSGPGSGTAAATYTGARALSVDVHG